MNEELLQNAQNMDADDFTAAEYLLTGETVKIVVRLSCAYFGARLVAGGIVYTDAFNDREPYDHLTHVFYVPQTALQRGMTLTFAALDSAEDGDLCKYTFTYTADFADERALLEAYDSGVMVLRTETEQIAQGLVYRHLYCADRNGAPVHAFLLEADMKHNTLVIGTPADGYENRYVKATVPAMIDAAVANGQPVLAAVNADFFDMWGDCSPSGLCVKNGQIVANADSARPFIGVLRDGTPVIASLAERPELLPELYQAAAGLQRILRDGRLDEWGPLEPFAYVRHPRTAVGLRADGTLLCLEVDGRIPDYSNGATLVDLAILLRKFGAEDAINLDGGGSSVVYTKGATGYELRTNPADLYRPTEKLIREEYNCLLITEKR